MHILSLDEIQVKLLIKVMTQNNPELSYSDIAQLSIIYTNLHNLLSLETPPYDEGPTESSKYKDYSWIKVKKWKDDLSKSYEERLALLEKHHIEETNWLLNEIKSLANKIDEKDKELRNGYS